jgi:hypothetical protein
MDQPRSEQTMDITADVDVEKQNIENDFSTLRLFFGAPSFTKFITGR